MTTSFVCDSCGCIDDIHATPQSGGMGFQCHECKYGTWHGNFPKQQWDSSVFEPMLNRRPSGESPDL